MGISVNNLSLTLGRHRALDGVTTAFPPGALSVVVGPNGAGKSSLLKVLAGLEPGFDGAISVGNTDLHTLTRKDRARRIAYLAQDPIVHWDITARDLILLGRHPHRDPLAPPAPIDKEMVERAMEMTDTAQFADRHVMSLSGGERMRVMIARLIAGEPEWILADEPMASLDPKHRIAVMALLKNLAQAGTGVIAVLHDLNEARRWADHAVIMKHGRVAKSGAASTALTPAALSLVFDTPMTEVTGADGAHHLIIG